MVNLVRFALLLAALVWLLGFWPFFIQCVVDWVVGMKILLAHKPR